MLDKRDAKFILDVPDKGFSPQRNKAVIERSIAKYEAMRAKKMKIFQEGIGERSEAVASFLEHVKQDKHHDIDRYFGPSMLAKLRGSEIIDTLRSKLNMIQTPSPVYVEGGMVKTIKGAIVGKEVSNAKKKLQRKEKLG